MTRPGNGALDDVSAAGPDLAWAVRYTGWEDSVATSLRTWNGSQWQEVRLEEATPAVWLKASTPTARATRG